MGLMSSLLTLLHGLYFPIFFLWLVFGPIAISEVPNLPSLLFPILDTIVYLFLAFGMLRGKRGFFVYSIVWAVWSALLATGTLSYGDGSYALNLLSFLIVFCSTYYYVNNNKANPDVSKAIGTVAGILALAQGITTAVVLAMPFAGLVAEADLRQTDFTSTLLLLLATCVIYLILGIGMLKKRKDFFLFAIFWTIVEAAFAVAYSPFLSTHLNIISVMITTSATYAYFTSKQR
jgi:hypothetical protein